MISASLQVSMGLRLTVLFKNWSWRRKSRASNCLVLDIGLANMRSWYRQDI